MTELTYFIGVVVSFVLTMIIGNYLYFVEHKKKYNFLNMFPFEMESKKNSKLTLLFRILLAVFISICSIDILYLFIFHFDSNFLTRFIGGILLLEGFMILGTFLVSTKLYKGHILVSSSLFILNMMSYFVLGYISLVNEYELWITIVSFVVGSILLIIILLPSLKEGFTLNKIGDEDNYILERKKVNLLSLFEWISILTFILNLLLNTIIYI